jgi:hypothetical protein
LLLLLLLLSVQLLMLLMLLLLLLLLVRGLGHTQITPQNSGNYQVEFQNCSEHFPVNITVHALRSTPHHAPHTHFVAPWQELTNLPQFQKAPRTAIQFGNRFRVIGNGAEQFRECWCELF